MSRTTQMSDDGMWDPETAQQINECDISIITVGNCGVGTSFLANILLGHPLFAHEHRARQVTRVTEVAFTLIRDRKAAVYNIPGLERLSKKNNELNKVQIEKAFEPLPVQVILSVFGVGDGGYLREEDLSTHCSIQAAFAIRNASTVFIINNVKPQLFNTEYFTYVTVIVKAVLNWPEGQPLPIVFLENFPTGVNIETDPRVHAFRASLIEAIDMANPHKHTKQSPINTSDDLAADVAKKLDNANEDYEVRKYQVKRRH